MTASERYYQLTNKKYVYNIMPIENIPSVLRDGIVCFERMVRVQHISIALSDVQKRRAEVVIPNGLRLHQYANLYFSYNNPMLYKRKAVAQTLCILAVSAEVLDIEGCVVSDQNAAASLVRFFSPADGLECLDFARIHAQYWTSTDTNTERNHKKIKCAEILVPEQIPASYIRGAYVFDEEAKRLLESKGFQHRIHISKAVFYG